MRGEQSQPCTNSGVEVESWHHFASVCRHNTSGNKVHVNLLEMRCICKSHEQKQQRCTKVESLKLESALLPRCDVLMHKLFLGCFVQWSIKFTCSKQSSLELESRTQTLTVVAQIVRQLILMLEARISKTVSFALQQARQPVPSLLITCKQQQPQRDAKPWSNPESHLALSAPQSRFCCFRLIGVDVRQRPALAREFSPVPVCSTIHRHSSDAPWSQPFVARNCDVVPLPSDWSSACGTCQRTRLMSILWVHVVNKCVP